MPVKHIKSKPCLLIPRGLLTHPSQLLSPCPRSIKLHCSIIFSQNCISHTYSLPSTSDKNKGRIEEKLEMEIDIEKGRGNGKGPKAEVWGVTW
jgi:hypothetical protein